MTATLVWEYRHTPDISAACTGSLKRIANGNTLIDWGCAVPTSGTIVTEVNSRGPGRLRDETSDKPGDRFRYCWAAV